MIEMIPDWRFIIFGRTVFKDFRHQHYMKREWWEFLNAITDPFNDVHYVCLSEPIKNASTDDDLAQIDPEVNIHDDTEWNGNDSALTRVRSLISNLQIRSREQKVITYSLLPRTYGFLVSPFALSMGDVNVLYYGKDATVSSKALQNGPLLNPLQRIGFGTMQRITVRLADITFTRDPRMIKKDRDSVQFSYPITSVTEAISAKGDIDIFQRNDRVTLLFVGKFRKSKGLKYLIKSAVYLQTQVEATIYLRLVGEGPRREPIETLVSTHDMSNRVHFTGYINDSDKLAAEYKQSDIFVLPSISEGFPRVLNEALAAGLPIIATKVGGIPTLLDNNKHAILVNPKSARELADAVEAIITDPNLRERLADNGRKRSQKLNGDPISQHLNSIIELISKKDRCRKGSN